MKIEICDEFFCRYEDRIYEEILKDEKFNVVRNNAELKYYEGEVLKLKKNDFFIHFVKPTENLYTIAKKYALDKERIIFDNNLAVEKLFIGQRLKIYNTK